MKFDPFITGGMLTSNMRVDAAQARSCCTCALRRIFGSAFASRSHNKNDSVTSRESKFPAASKVSSRPERTVLSSAQPTNPRISFAGHDTMGKTALQAARAVAFTNNGEPWRPAAFETIKPLNANAAFSAEPRPLHVPSPAVHGAPAPAYLPCASPCWSRSGLPVRTHAHA